MFFFRVKYRTTLRIRIVRVCERRFSEGKSEASKLVLTFG
jgi:hypothetical protein